MKTQNKRILKQFLPALLFSVAVVAKADNNSAWPPKDDASARTWLPVPEAATTPVMDEFLKSLDGHLRILGCWYEGSQLRANRSFTGGRLTAGDDVWTCDTRFTPASAGAADLVLTFKLASGAAKSAGVAVAFDFNDWSTNNYILVPAQIYGGNRFRILPIGYPPYIYDEKNRPLDLPVTTTDIEHLNPDGAHAKIELNAGNVATPMLSFWNPSARRGFILLAEQDTRFGNNGLFIEEDAGPKTGRKRITFAVSAPGVREQRYVMCGRAASGDQGAAWNPGDELSLKFKVYNFAARDLPAFYEKVFAVRKALTGANAYSCVTPYSAAAGLLLEHFDSQKWFEQAGRGYYCNRPGGHSPFGYQIGWSGMPVYGFPSLIDETPEHLRRVCLSLEDMLFGPAQGKTGLFHAMNRNGEIFGDTFSQMSQRRSIAMTRRSMDALYFGLQTFELMKQRGHGELFKPAWEKSLRACADGLVKVWDTYGQFGQFIDVDTGRMDINGSTAGCAAGSALALASQYFHEPKYLEVAEAATKMYYERDFLKGYAGGGAAEILQSPDSEAPWDMVESCVALYEITGKREWVDRAKFATHMLATWMVSYDYQFPKGSAMQVAGTHAAGSIFASSQNNHSAPGYYILSGDCLLKLFRATGDRLVAEMYKDQSHNVVQYVGAPHNPLRHESGYVTERVQLSDWEGGDIGSVNRGDSNMAWEILAALTCLENPGIYLHTNDDTFLVMDHVEARITSRDASGVTISIINPTAYDAAVSIFAESAKQAEKPLGWGAYDQWPKVRVKAGETRIVIIGRDGKLKS